MSSENNTEIPNRCCDSLRTVKELVYDECGYELTNVEHHPEGKEYEACSYNLNGQTIEHRVSKITPKKNGQFVAIWKRNEQGLTAPWDVADKLDFIIITARQGDALGQFIFSKSVLADKGILTNKGKEGKRGIRVYPPWDIPGSKQAEKTQAWQLKYFLSIKHNGSCDLALARELLTSTRIRGL